MRSYIITGILLVLSISNGCKQKPVALTENAGHDEIFQRLSETLVDDLWKMYPSWALDVGFHNYDTILEIPDEEFRKKEISFCRFYIDSLQKINSNSLTAVHRSEYMVLENALQSILWANQEFREDRWNPSIYNIGESFDKILCAGYVTGAEKMRVLYKRMKNVPDYYLTAQNNIDNPTLEHTRLAIDQHQGVIKIFDSVIRDSINKASLGENERQMMETRLNRSVQAIRDYAEWLEKSLIPTLRPENTRSFRIGRELYNKKFGFEITKSTYPEGIYRKALMYKTLIQDEMVRLCLPQWKKYFPGQPQPNDQLMLVQKILHQLSSSHPHRDSLLQDVRKQIPELSEFIIKHKLLADAADKPLVIRETPEYMRGIAGASISAPGLYEKDDTTYYNVTPLTGFSDQEAESYLREYNRYSLRILNIHEAIPGHYVQFVYSNKANSVINRIFHNTGLVEGWAVYAERMMMEEGYSTQQDGSGAMDTAMWLLYYKWHLRVICNTILDYSVHVLGMSETDAILLLTHDAFQEETEAREKWKRVTLTQVQLTSYFAGYLEIYSLREMLRDRNPRKFDLLSFHENFLSYGSIPVSIIRERMIESNQQP